MMMMSKGQATLTGFTLVHQQQILQACVILDEVGLYLPSIIVSIRHAETCMISHMLLQVWCSHCNSQATAAGAYDVHTTGM
jgi:hypothetical protein